MPVVLSGVSPENNKQLDALTVYLWLRVAFLAAG